MTVAPPAVETGTLLAELLALPAEERLPYLRAAGDPEALVLALSEEADGLAAVEVARALAASEMVVGLADELDTPRVRAESRGARAMVLAYAGRLDEALPTAEQAVSIARAANLQVVAARAQLASIHALALLGRHQEAIDLGDDARATFEEAGELTLAARADANIGAVYQEKDDPATALHYYDRARPGMSGDPVALAQLEANRGNALVSLDAFVQAEGAFRIAVEGLAAPGLEWAVAIAQGNLAHLATRQGKLEAALYHFEKARRCLEDDESPAELARLLAEQANTLDLLGLPGEAVSIYERVLPDLERFGLAADSAAAYAGLGRALLRLKRFPEAEPALATAGAAFDALSMVTPRAKVDLLRAELAAVTGRQNEARALLHGALDVLRDRPAESMVAHHQIARLAFDDGDLPAVERELAAALDTAAALDLAPALADLLHARGLLRQACGEPALGLADLRAAVSQVERVRGTLQAERFRAAFLGNKLAIYEDFVGQALDGDDPATVAEAFGVVEQAKSRALLDLVSGALDLAEAAERETDDPTEAALLADLARLRNELNWLYSGLGGDDDEGARAGRTADEWQRAVADRERELDALQDRIAVARGVAGLYAPPLDLAGALAALPAGAALVEYFVAGQELVVFVLRDGDVSVARHLATPDDLAEAVRRVHFQIGRALVGGDRARNGPRSDRLLADVRRELGALDDLLLAPIRDAIAGADRLVIVPHGPLHTLPFHALWDGERHLIERAEVVYAPSASVLAHLPTLGDAARNGRDALVVGVPDAVAPRIAAEAERVARTLGTDRLLLGEAATIDRVVAAARDADVVHLACHGRFAPESPLGSGIKLGDGWITARDVYALQLRASLVTLSGCETGRAVVGGGDELVGLVRGFFAAGASSLILSLWIVNDASTADLMTAFYDAWCGGASKPAALRAAQRDLLARRPHPAFWAPFVLGGQP